MALTAVPARQAKAIGSFTEMAVGVAGGSGTSTVVTVPNMSTVQGAVVTGDTGTTAMYVGTVSGNTFTVTHGSGDRFTWIAVGIPRV